MVNVFPVPGPAATRNAPSGPARTASACSPVSCADEAGEARLAPTGGCAVRPGGPGQVVHQQLDVVGLSAEVLVVSALGRLPPAGLVVHDLAGPLPGVVDPVDLAVDLGPVQPERELPLDHQRAQPPDRLRAGGEAD